jgi:hypothetical protein
VIDLRAAKKLTVGALSHGRCFGALQVWRHVEEAVCRARVQSTRTE